MLGGDSSLRLSPGLNIAETQKQHGCALKEEIRNQCFVLPGTGLRAPRSNHNKNGSCDPIKTEEDQRTDPGPNPEPSEAPRKHQDVECVGQPSPTEHDIGDQINSPGGHQSPCNAKCCRTARNSCQDPADSKGKRQRNY